MHACLRIVKGTKVQHLQPGVNCVHSFFYNPVFYTFNAPKSRNCKKCKNKNKVLRYISLFELLQSLRAKYISTLLAFIFTVFTVSRF